MTTMELLIFEWKTVLTFSIATVGFIMVIIHVYNGGLDK